MNGAARSASEQSYSDCPIHPPEGAQNLLSYTTRRGATDVLGAEQFKLLLLFQSENLLFIGILGFLVSLSTCSGYKPRSRQ